MPEPSLVIAISRQRGSGGAEIGRRLSDSLGLRYFDRQLLRHAAEFLQAQDERPGGTPGGGSLWSRIGEAIGMGSCGFGHLPPPLHSLEECELAGVEERLLNEIAAHGRAVIVGCGAAQTLKGRAGVFSVFLHAPTEWRIARLRQVYSLDAPAAEQAVRAADRSRSRFAEQITGAPWTRPGSYDLSLDTSTLGIDACAALIVDAVHKVKSEK